MHKLRIINNKPIFRKKHIYTYKDLPVTTRNSHKPHKHWKGWMKTKAGNKDHALQQRPWVCLYLRLKGKSITMYPFGDYLVAHHSDGQKIHFKNWDNL